MLRSSCSLPFAWRVTIGFEESVEPLVHLADSSLLLGVLHDDVGPVLRVRARRCLERELEQAQYHVVRDGLGGDQPPHRALGLHRVGHRMCSRASISAGSSVGGSVGADPGVVTVIAGA